MKCPTCVEENLIMSERHGVEIDYCPRCRGVWLDKGELDKILERAATATGPVAAQTAAAQASSASPPPPPLPSHAQPYPPHGRPARRDDDSVDEDAYDGDRYRRKRKRGGWLGEIFDFD